MNQGRKKVFEEPIKMLLVFYTYGKSDIDNLAKNILDACNGILYKDDSQVMHLEIEKKITKIKKKEHCGVEIYAWGMEGEQS